jgi:tetratricopeptide (TPR) repeat protein
MSPSPLPARPSPLPARPSPLPSRPSPLPSPDLHDAIDDVRRTDGPRGVVDLLVAALTDRQVRRDSDIDEHLDTLKSACRQTRRYRDAIPVFHRIAVLNPDRKHEVAAELALVHSHLGERAKAVSLLESALAQQRRLPTWRRSLAFSLVAELAASVLRLPTLAQECAAIGRSTVAPVRRRSRPAKQPVLAELDLAEVGLEITLPEPVRPRLTLVGGTAA